MHYQSSCQLWQFMLINSKAAQTFIKFVWNFWSNLISTSTFKHLLTLFEGWVGTNMLQTKSQWMSLSLVPNHLTLLFFSIIFKWVVTFYPNIKSFFLPHLTINFWFWLWIFSDFQTLPQLSGLSIWKVYPSLKESSSEFRCFNVTLNNCISLKKQTGCMSYYNWSADIGIWNETPQLICQYSVNFISTA